MRIKPRKKNIDTKITNLSSQKVPLNVATCRTLCKTHAPEPWIHQSSQFPKRREKYGEESKNCRGKKRNLIFHARSVGEGSEACVSVRKLSRFRGRLACHRTDSWEIDRRPSTALNGSSSLCSTFVWTPNASLVGGTWTSSVTWMEKNENKIIYCRRQVYNV